MNTTKSYIRPVTNMFRLSPKERMMDTIADSLGHAGAPIRLPEDN